MIERIDRWVQQVNWLHKEVRQCCSIFEEQFSGYYPPEFLSTAFFVVTDIIPKPDFPELRALGVGDFLDMDVAGITYNDTYYVKKESVSDLLLHFHELVHVVQWQELTPPGFIKRYIQEMQCFGYKKAPLEKMAYELGKEYKKQASGFSVVKLVQENL